MKKRKQLPKETSVWQSDMHLMAAMKHTCYAYHTAPTRHRFRRLILWQIAVSIISEVTARKYKRRKSSLYQFGLGPLVIFDLKDYERWTKSNNNIIIKMLGQPEE